MALNFILFFQIEKCLNVQFSTNLVASGSHRKGRCGPLAHRLHPHLIELIHTWQRTWLTFYLETTLQMGFCFLAIPTRALYKFYLGLASCWPFDSVQLVAPWMVQGGDRLWDTKQICAVHCMCTRQFSEQVCGDLSPHFWQVWFWLLINDIWTWQNMEPGDAACALFEDYSINLTQETRPLRSFSRCVLSKQKNKYNKIIYYQNR